MNPGTHPGMAWQDMLLLLTQNVASQMKCSPAVQPVAKSQ